MNSPALTFFIRLKCSNCGQRKKIRGQSKKSESWAVHLLICWLFLLFHSNNMHKCKMRVWFLTRQMPILSGWTNFDSFLKFWKIFTPKCLMKSGILAFDSTAPCGPIYGRFVVPWNRLHLTDPCNKGRWTASWLRHSFYCDYALL